MVIFHSYVSLPEGNVGKTIMNIRRKFRSQTSDNMDRWKAGQGRGREKRKIRREKGRRERVRKKKIQMREKVGKSRNTVFFQWFVAPEGRKVGSLKRRVRSQLARWEMKNCTPLWRESHFEVKCTKHTILGPLLEVEMSKKSTPLWREVHFEVKMYKTLGVRTTFGGSDVEKVHAVVARSTFRSQNVKNTRGSDHSWRFRFRFTTLHYITLHYTPLHSITVHYMTQHYNHNYTTTLHYTKVHYTTLHYTTLHSTTIHYTTLHYITLNDTAPQIDR